MKQNQAQGAAPLFIFHVDKKFYEPTTSDYLAWPWAQGLAQGGLVEGEGAAEILEI